MFQICSKYTRLAMAFLAVVVLYGVNAAPVVAGDTVVDTSHPTTTAAPNPAVPNGTNGWYTTQPVMISLTANDPDDMPPGSHSDVAATYYTVNGGATQTYQGFPFNVSAEGMNTVAFWSVDKANNTETPNSLTIKIDTVPPMLTIPSDMMATQTDANGATVPFAVSGSDPFPGSGITTVDCSPSPAQFPVGTTTVICTATDAAGNQTIKSFRVTVVPPPTTPGANVAADGSLTVSSMAQYNLGTAHFGINVQNKPPTGPLGTLWFLDTLNGIQVQAKKITAIVVTGGNSATIFGTAVVNGVAGFNFRLDLNLGRGPKTNAVGGPSFQLQLDNGYSAGGTFIDGSIKTLLPSGP